MTPGKTTTLRIADLADQLAEDIAARHLKTGDRYLTAAEASKKLGVGNGAANKALQLLERRRLIIRQQRRGAVIADPPALGEAPAFDRVHFLVHQKYLQAEGIGQDDLLLGIEHEIPGVRVQISFLPSAQEEAFVAELIDESLRAKRTEGFVLVRSSYEVQRLVVDRQVPAVVYGTLYPSIRGITSLTVDMHAVGLKLANYLLDRGHCSIAYLNRQMTYGGDQRTMEGIQEAMSLRNCRPDALKLRFLPSAEEVYLAAATQLLSAGDPVTGFICRSVRMADVVSEAGRRVGRKLGDGLDVTVCDSYLKRGERSRYAATLPREGSESQGRLVARLLVRQLQIDADRVENRVMPVELREAKWRVTT